MRRGRRPASPSTTSRGVRVVAAAVAATTACSGWSAATTQALVAEGKAARVRAREAPAAPAPSTRSTAGARPGRRPGDGGPEHRGAAHDDDPLGVEPLQLGRGHPGDAVGPGQQHGAPEHRRGRDRGIPLRRGRRRRRGRRPVRPPYRGRPPARPRPRSRRGRRRRAATSAGGPWARRRAPRGSVRPRGRRGRGRARWRRGRAARGAQRSGVRGGERPRHGQTDPDDGHDGRDPEGQVSRCRCRHDRRP